MVFFNIIFSIGGDLSQRILNAKGKNFPENQILDWFTQICLALRHCHEKRILHRDLKAKNVFLTSKNFVKLGDFGIARVLANTVDKAKTVVGTPYYLSPEIIQNKSYGLESDIWSLGVLLYEMCALKPPFDASSLSALAMKIIRGTYPQIPAQYSKELKTLLASCLSIDSIKRPNIHKVLRSPIIHSRIEGFMSQTVYNMQFTNSLIKKEKIVPTTENDDHKKVMDYLDKLREKAGPIHGKQAQNKKLTTKPIEKPIQVATAQRNPSVGAQKKESPVGKDRPKNVLPPAIKKSPKPAPTPPVPQKLPPKKVTPPKPVALKTPPAKDKIDDKEKERQERNHKRDEERRKMKEEIEKLKKQNKNKATNADVPVCLVQHVYNNSSSSSSPAVNTEPSSLETSATSSSHEKHSPDNLKPAKNHTPPRNFITEVSPAEKCTRPVTLDKRGSSSIKDQIRQAKQKYKEKGGKTTLDNFSEKDVLVNGAKMILEVEKVASKITEKLKVQQKENSQHEEDVAHLVNEMQNVFFIFNNQKKVIEK